MRIKICKIDKKGETKLLCRIYSVKGKLFFEGDEILINNLKNEGILDKSVRPPRLVYPKDGEVFLKALLSSLNSPYLFAVEEKEG